MSIKTDWHYLTRYHIPTVDWNRWIFMKSSSVELRRSTSANDKQTVTKNSKTAKETGYTLQAVHTNPQYYTSIHPQGNFSWADSHDIYPIRKVCKEQKSQNSAGQWTPLKQTLYTMLNYHNQEPSTLHLIIYWFTTRTVHLLLALQPTWMSTPVTWARLHKAVHTILNCHIIMNNNTLIRLVHGIRLTSSRLRLNYVDNISTTDLTLLTSTKQLHDDSMLNWHVNNTDVINFSINLRVTLDFIWSYELRCYNSTTDMSSDGLTLCTITDYCTNTSEMHIGITWQLSETT